MADISGSVNLSLIVQGATADASDVTIPLNNLITVINDILNGNETFDAIDVTDGSGIAGIDAANITTGTLPEARLPSDPTFNTINTGSIQSSWFLVPSTGYIRFRDGSSTQRLQIEYGTDAVDFLVYDSGGSLVGTAMTINTDGSIDIGDGSGIEGLDGGNIATGTVAAARLADITLAKVTDAGTIASQNADSVDINGGAVDNTVIGGTTPAAATITTVTATTSLILNNGVIFNFHDSGGVSRARFSHNESGTPRFQVTTWNAAGTYINAPMEFGTTDNTVVFYGKIGFNKAGVTKPTVTGSKGGNAALASLLTALANIGLITDSTT
jgi:hypothetical protein